MRNEMETNLPREPANLEGLKDTLAHRTHTHLHTYVSGYLDYQNIMFRYYMEAQFKRTSQAISYTVKIMSLHQTRVVV